MMKRYVAFMLCLAMFFSMITIKANAEPVESDNASPAFEITAGELNPFSPDENVTIRLTVSAIYIDDLAGVDLDIGFDSAKLQPANLIGRYYFTFFG